MSNSEADFVTILSSEMISDIVQSWMNAEMYKRPVSIVDLKATDAGYMFSVMFVTGKGGTVINNDNGTVANISVMKGHRNHKGQFVKVGDNG